LEVSTILTAFHLHTCIKYTGMPQGEQRIAKYKGIPLHKNTMIKNHPSYFDLRVALRNPNHGSLGQPQGDCYALFHSNPSSLSRLVFMYAFYPSTLLEVRLW
jgi:hypothetical protein